MAVEDTYTVSYQFRFPDGTEKIFDVNLDKTTGALLQAPRKSYPKWTQLSYRQCQHCPLKESTCERCPVAVSIIDVVDFFYLAASNDKAEVTVVTPQRTITQNEAGVQKAISSLIGLYMVTCGCPIMNRLRPMARFHLPFASSEETVYRALSMYVLGQYFRRKEGKSPDWSMEGLGKCYKDINKLNADFARRLINFESSDATTNALTSLDCFAQLIEFSITEEILEELEQLFQGYLN